MRYLSKLDAFEEFSLRAKMPALALTRAQPDGAGTSGDVGSGAAGGSGAGPSALPAQQQKQQRPPGMSQQPGAAQQALAGSQRPAAAARQAAASAAQVPKLLIVDDLPHAANPEQRQRLAAALGALVGQ